MYQTRTRLPMLLAAALTLNFFAAGCGGEPGTLDEQSGALESSESEHRHQGSCKDNPVIYTRTPLGPNRYFFFQKVTVNPSPGRVWTEVRDLEKLVAIALPGVAEDFQWVDGGGPERVPSRFQFVVSGTTIHEEVYARDQRRHSVRYRLLVPALGIASYDAEVKLLSADKNQTTLVFARDITFDAGADPTPLTDLIGTEGIAIRDHFCK